jgi:hypothetical protein
MWFILTTRHTRQEDRTEDAGPTQEELIDVIGMILGDAV